MTKLTYVVNGKEVNTLAEAKILAKNSKDITTRYTPIENKRMTKTEVSRRDLRMKAYGLC